MSPFTTSNNLLSPQYTICPKLLNLTIYKIHLSSGNPIYFRHTLLSKVILTVSRLGYVIVNSGVWWGFQQWTWFSTIAQGQDYLPDWCTWLVGWMVTKHGCACVCTVYIQHITPTQLLYTHFFNYHAILSQHYTWVHFHTWLGDHQTWILKVINLTLGWIGGLPYGFLQTLQGTNNHCVSYVGSVSWRNWKESVALQIVKSTASP